MSRPALRVDVPRLEPSDVLVAQLAGLAAAGAPAGASAAAPHRLRWVVQVVTGVVAVLLVAAAAALVGGRGTHEPVPAVTPTTSAPAPTLPSASIRPRPLVIPRTEPGHAPHTQHAAADGRAAPPSVAPPTVADTRSDAGAAHADADADDAGTEPDHEDIADDAPDDDEATTPERDGDDAG